jgi:hypothetical protein
VPEPISSEPEITDPGRREYITFWDPQTY